MKLLVTAPMAEADRHRLSSYFQEIAYYPWTKNGKGTGYNQEEIIELLKKERPDALISELDEITEHVLEEYDRLQIIGDCRANPANIQVEACNKRKIPIVCTPARNAQAVAELLVGLLINFYRNVQPSIQWVKDGCWREGTLPYSIFMGHELYGKHIGFVGFGAVGRTTAGILRAFGCDISYYDPYVVSDNKDYKKKELEEIFQECDVVSIHLPVTESTKGMIDGRLIGRMKPDAVFVNTARSAVIDTKALEKALQEGRIRGAVLDVLDHEPPKEEEMRLIHRDNVLYTPHICGAAYEVTDHQSQIICDKMEKWGKQENLEKVIYNPQILN